MNAGRAFVQQWRRNLRNSRSWMIFKSAAITILLPYTSYALYVSYCSVAEVDRRKEQLKMIEQGSPNPTGTQFKYATLQVLGRYENPFTEYRIQTVYEFFFNRIVELFERNRGGIPTDKTLMDKLMPVHKPDWSMIDNHEKLVNFRQIKDGSVSKSSPPTSSHNYPIYNTWLGQSCNYVVYNGLKILTDPLFSDYLIHPKLGPKRITAQPCPIDQVPDPDIILVSHNHPDHLDQESLQRWKETNTLWIVPKGMRTFMEKHGVKYIQELSWWENCEIQKDNETYLISSTPAMHWSGRSVLDTNQSLWCSFMLTHHNKPIMFHAGDTGYVKDLFKRISNYYGEGCKLAILPCGQYCPEWHQKPRHINPQEVLQIMNDMKAQNVLGVHWGTFVLSGEYFREPKEKLELLAEWSNLKDRCFCPELGKTLLFT